MLVERYFKVENSYIQNIDIVCMKCSWETRMKCKRCRGRRRIRSQRILTLVESK